MSKRCDERPPEMALVVSVLSIALASPEPPLIDQVRQTRAVRSAGLAVGASLLVGAGAVSVGGGLIEGGTLLPVVAGGGALAALAVAREYVSNSEQRSPLDEASYFEVRESQPGMGSGLYARRAIEAESFLFDYTGDVLDEEQMFARYPLANGRYVACITDDLYIDAAPVERSSVARWMNHGPKERANVAWRKQRLGPNKAMHFYTLRDIAVGEELYYDCARPRESIKHTHPRAARASFV